MSPRLSHEAASQMLATIAVSKKDVDRSPLGVINRAVDHLRHDYPELIALLVEAEWAERVAAFCRLNIPVEHSIVAATDVFRAQGYLETALLRLIDERVLVPVIALTPEANEDLSKLRKSVAFHGLLPALEVKETEEVAEAKAEVEAKSEALLDAEVIADWRNLPTFEIRSKCRDAAYKTRFDQLMNEGKLGR